MPQNASTPFYRIFPNNFSSIQEDHPSIPVGSTLSVIGALLTIARERFMKEKDESIPWGWVRDASVPGYMEDTKKSNITIEIDLHSDNAAKEKKPAVIIGRDAVTFQKVFLDDKAGEARKTGRKLRYSQGYGSFSFSCRSYEKGTPEILANIMLEWLMYNNDIFRKFFQFHELGPFSIGKEVPMQKSSDVYECVVQFRLVWEHRWSTEPLAPQLRHLVAKIYGTDDPTEKLGSITDSDTLLTEIAVASLSRNQS